MMASRLVVNNIQLIKEHRTNKNSGNSSMLSELGPAQAQLVVDNFLKGNISVPDKLFSSDLSVC